jgi:hypothetical protein
MEPKWYPDPAGSGGQRYWDGHSWTAYAPQRSAVQRFSQGLSRQTKILIAIGIAVLLTIALIVVVGAEHQLILQAADVALRAVERQPPARQPHRLTVREVVDIRVEPDDVAEHLACLCQDGRPQLPAVVHRAFTPGHACSDDCGTTWCSSSRSVTPTLTVGLALFPASVKVLTGEMAETLRWSQMVIDLAEGNRARGDYVVGSPMALAYALRFTAGWVLGHSGWREDFNRAVAMARDADPISQAVVNTYTYASALACGVIVVDDAALRDIDEALENAQRSLTISILASPCSRRQLYCGMTIPRSGNAGWNCWGRFVKWRWAAGFTPRWCQSSTCVSPKR